MTFTTFRYAPRNDGRVASCDDGVMLGCTRRSGQTPPDFWLSFRASVGWKNLPHFYKVDPSSGGRAGYNVRNHCAALGRDDIFSYPAAGSAAAGLGVAYFNMKNLMAFTRLLFYAADRKSSCSCRITINTYRSFITKEIISSYGQSFIGSRS